MPDSSLSQQIYMKDLVCNNSLEGATSFDNGELRYFEVRDPANKKDRNLKLATVFLVKGMVNSSHPFML